MSTARRNLTVTLLTLLLVAAGWYVAHERRLQTEQREAEATRRLSALLSGVELSRTETPSPLREVATPLPANEAATAVPLQVLPASNVPAPLPVLMADPVLQSKYFRARQLAVPFAYGPFLETLRLSPEKEESFRKLLAEREEMFFDTVATVPAVLRKGNWYAGGGAFVRQNFYLSASNDPELSKSSDARAALELLKRNTAAFEDATITLIGGDNVRKLQQYERMLPVRDVVDGLGASLAHSTSPLRSPQAEDLTRLVAEAVPGYANGGLARPDKVDWDVVLLRAPQILNPSQVEALRLRVADLQARRNLERTLQTISR